MAYFPMFVQLKKKKCLVIGGGSGPGHIRCAGISVLTSYRAATGRLQPGVGRPLNSMPYRGALRPDPRIIAMPSGDTRERSWPPSCPNCR